MLSLASLRARWASLLGGFVAVMLGVIMLTAVGLLLTSAQPQMPQRFAAAEIVVQSPDPEAPADSFLPRRPWSPSQVEGLVADLSAIPGVAAAIPDMPFYAQAVVDGRPADVVEGNAWPAAALAGETLIAGRPPQREGEVALPGHAPGERVTFLVAQGPRDFTVTGTVRGKGQYFHHFSSVRAIGLLTSGHVDLAQVERAVAGRGNVLAGDARSALEPVNDARIRWIGLQVLTAMAALSGFAAVFLVASTFSFTVLQRTREIGLLRAVGATPAQVRRMLLAEATAVGLAAGACGVVLGTALAPLLGRVLVRAGFEPPSFAVRLTTAPLALALLTGLMVALAGVGLASRRAGKVPPLAALRAADAERRPMTRTRWIAGLGAAAVGALFTFATATADPLYLPTTAMGAVMALVTAMSLLSPAFAPGLARILLAPFTSDPAEGRRTRRKLPRGGALGVLVRQSTAANARRTAATAAPVMLAVAFTVLVAGMVQTGAQAYAARRAGDMPGSTVVIPNGTPGLTAAAVAEAGPGADSLLPTTLWHGEIPLPAVGLSPTAFEAAAGEAGRRGDVVVTQDVAQRHALATGSTMMVTVASGQTQELRIVAVVPQAPAGFVLRRNDAQRFDPDALTQVVLLRDQLHKPHAPEALPADPGAKVVTAAEYAALADAEEDRLVWTFALLLIGMAGGFTVIAVINTLLMDVVARRREVLALNRLGATASQLTRMVALETGFVVIMGSLLGGGVATAGLLGVRTGLSAQTGHPVTLVFPWPATAFVILACLAAALATCLAQLRRSLRHGL